MSVSLPDYGDQVSAAVASYWQVRTEQAERSRAAGVVNTGLRSEVTGGRHLDALELLLVSVLVDAGIPGSMLEVKRRPVPGYFRRDKSWDIVVTVHGRVLAIVELKSIVGEDPGQNFNNRTDEALGQAMDIWKAVSAVWPADPTFNGTSASDRAAIFFDRMVRERLLDAACVVMANRSTGHVRYKQDNLAFPAFAAAMFGRCLQFRATNLDLAWPA